MARVAMGAQAFLEKGKERSKTLKSTPFILKHVMYQNQV